MSTHRNEIGHESIHAVRRGGSRSRFLLSLGALTVAGCSGGGSSPPASTSSSGGSSGSGSGSGGSGTSGPSGLRGVGDVSTYFTDYFGQQAPGYSYAQPFTLGGTTNFVFRCASDYTAQFAVMNASQESAFLNGQAYTAINGFNNQFGTVSISLPAGSYAVGARNSSSSTNGVRFELDYAVAVPSADDYRFAGYLLNGAAEVAPGVRATAAFTLQSGYRYFMDGCNSGGLSVYIMPASAVSAFTSGNTFSYYTTFSGSTPDEPGFYELTTEIGAGSYAIGWYNSSSQTHAIVYTLEGWAPT